MVNAREELTKILKEIGYTYDDIKCFNIRFYPKCCEPAKVAISGNDPEELKRNLNFDYDDGYGAQHLFGLVLFKDNTWLERAEYDGSEWWEHRKPITCEDVKNFEGE